MATTQSPDAEHAEREGADDASPNFQARTAVEAATLDIPPSDAERAHATGGVGRPEPVGTDCCFQCAERYPVAVLDPHVWFCPACLRDARFERLESSEGYPVYRYKIGGREPDGTPTRLGKWTFATKIVRDEVLDAVHGRVLNACAGQTKLEKRGCEFVRNDLDESIDADTHVDVRAIDDHFEAASFDSAVLDPPFDPGQAAELYEGWHGQEYSDCRSAVGRLVRPGGTIVELGWNSSGLGDADGWERQAWYVFPQASFKADVHLTVDQRVNQQTLGGESV